jgi:hypothetical protein
MADDPFFSLPQSSEWNALIGEQSERTFYAEGYIEAAAYAASSCDRSQFAACDAFDAAVKIAFLSLFRTDSQFLI